VAREQPVPLGPDGHRARSVAEEHAGGAIAVVDDRRHFLGPHDQRVAVPPGSHEPVCDRQSVQPSSAGSADVERGRPVRSDARLSLAGRRREEMVGRGRREHDHVHVQRIHARRLQSPPAGLRREVGRVLALLAHPSLTNPRPGADPLVGRVDHLLQIRVRHDPIRNRHSRAPDEAGVERRRFEAQDA
jgi:hypothetical protein